MFVKVVLFALLDCKILEDKNVLLYILHRVWVGPHSVKVCLIEWVNSLPSSPLVQVCNTRSSEHNTKGRKDSVDALWPWEWRDPGATKDEILFIGLAAHPCGAFSIGSPKETLTHRKGASRRWIRGILLQLSCHQEIQDLPDSHMPNTWGVGRTWKALQLEICSPIILMNVSWNS